ncbi:MAG: CNP1-like family protein [Pseudomonadota bacterium]
MYKVTSLLLPGLRAVYITLLACPVAPVFAGVLPPEDGPVGSRPPPAEVQPAREQALVLPAYPEQARLLELDIDTGANPFRYYLDPASLSVGKDRVVRFTSVIVSPSGVWNVTYEGLHCGENAQRRFAYGADGNWHVLPETDWERIRGEGTQRYRKVLYDRYMCPATEPPQAPEQILRRLRSARPALGD